MSKNKIIFYMSVLSKKDNDELVNDKYKYWSERINCNISATQTNEAAVKYLITLLKKNGEKLDEIIYIATNEVMNRVIQGTHITTEQYFIDRINTFCDDISFKRPNYTHIYASDRSIPQILSSLTPKIESKDNIYIDTTGGLRDAAYILILLSRIMEYTGANTRLAIYSQLNNKESNSCNKILETTEIFSMFELLNGVNEFARFGDSTSLCKCFENTKDAPIENLLKFMNEFSDSIQLCRTDGLDDNIQHLMEAIQDVEKSSDIREQNSLLLVKLLPLVKSKLYISEDYSINILKIIRWCIDNNMIQQALTLYVEKVPKYLFMNKYIDGSKSELNSIIRKKAEYEDAYMNIFYSTFMTYSSKNDCLINKLAERMDEIKLNGFSDRSFSKYVNDKNIGEAITILYGLKKRWESKIYKKQNRICQDSKLDERARKVLKLIINDNTSEYKYESVFNTVINNKKAARILLNIEVNDNTIDNKIRAIENFDKKCFADYSFSFKADKVNEYMRILLLDYLYIKVIRNQINHASDKDNFNQEQKQYFSDRDYCVYDISTHNIGKSILSCLNHIEDIKNNRI